MIYCQSACDIDVIEIGAETKGHAEVTGKCKCSCQLLYRCRLSVVSCCIAVVVSCSCCCVALHRLGNQMISHFQYT